MKKRIVIKIGTNVLTDTYGKLDFKIIESLVNDIAKIKNQGKEILLVTSGAIGAGMEELNIKKRPTNIKMQQACAAVGQSILISKYKEFFNVHKIKVAQILLTYNDFSNKESEINLGNSINTLLKLKVIPIINENDPISINEIGPSFGDNDKLSVMVAKEVKAEILILLTAVDGLYDQDPKYKGAKIIKEVYRFNKKITYLDGKSMLGIGGIKSKITSAKLATGSGILTIIANGKRKNTLIELNKGKKLGTIFYPKK